MTNWSLLDPDLAKYELIGWTPQPFESFEIWGPSELQDFFKLVGGRLAREEWLAIDYFSQHAPQTPDVSGLTVGLRAEQHFWRAVPPGGDVFGEDQLGVFFLDEAADEAEVDEFDWIK